MQHNSRKILGVLIATVLALNAFIAGLLGYAMLEAKARKEREVRTTVENLALLLDQSVGSSVREIDLLLRGAQNRIERALRDKGRLERDDFDSVIDVHRDGLSQTAQVRVSDATGTVVLGDQVTAETRTSYADRPFFIDHRALDDGEMQASKLLHGRISNTWIVVFSRRYNAPDGDFAGVVTAAVPADHFQRLLSGLQLGPHGIAWCATST